MIEPFPSASGFCVLLFQMVLALWESVSFPDAPICQKLFSLKVLPLLENRHLQSVIIAEGVTAIGIEAFSRNSNLVSVQLPLSLTEIGRDAFWLCENLSSVTIPSQVKSMANAFRDSGIRSVTFEESITDIPTASFKDCSHLMSINFPFTVKIIGANAFRNTAISTIEFPEGVTAIEDDALSGCSLTKVTLPSSLSSIGQYAFSSVRQGTVFICHAITPPSVYNTTFHQLQSPTFFISRTLDYRLTNPMLIGKTFPTGECKLSLCHKWLSDHLNELYTYGTFD